MKKVLALVLVFVLLFGCLDIFGKPPQPAGNVTVPGQNGTNKTPGGVVITSDTNQSVAHNETPGGQPQGDGTEVPASQYTETPDAVSGIYFIYVGDADHQGDAILIKKGDADILVDAGPAVNAGKVTDFLKGKGVDDIELLVSTNPDTEHYGGLGAVLDKYDIGEFWWVGNTYDDAGYSTIVSRLRSANVPMRAVSKGDKTTINGMTIEVMNPSQPGGAFGTGEGRYNDAVVLKITDREMCVLLTSDIEYGAQSRLVASGANLKCDVLQMPYHGLGSGNSQIDTFLLKVAPKYAVISGGPSDMAVDGRGTRPALYERMRMRGVTWFENYIGGTVQVVNNGLSYNVSYVTPPKKGR
jgi:beta-lactamase superfamily II metal-dependent hydrolase